MARRARAECLRCNLNRQCSIWPVSGAIFDSDANLPWHSLQVKSLGTSVAATSDLDRDGVGDIVVGSAGEVFVLHMEAAPATRRVGV